MAENKLSEIISTSLDSIKAIADTGTVIGEPISTNNGTVIIPVSKVSLGFASGGLDYMSKTESKDGTAKAAPKPSTPCFGGGGGTGMAVTPICFLVIKQDGTASILNISNPGPASAAVGIMDSVSTIADRAPDILSKIKSVFSKKKPEDSLDDEILKTQLEEDAK